MAKAIFDIEDPQAAKPQPQDSYALPLADRGVRERVSAAEWNARIELAALYRIVAHFKWTDTIFNHISYRVESEEGKEAFLLNPFGYLYHEITASCLVKVDLDGNILDDPTGLGINRAGFIIHSAVHKARHEVSVVLHTHTRAGIAVAAMEEGLLPISQHAAMLVRRVAYHDFEGVAIRPEEQERLVANLGDKPVMILRNHGLLVAGRSAADAFNLINNIERSCEIQVAALSGGCAVRRISEESIDASMAALAGGAGDEAIRRDWSAMRRLLAEVSPGYDV